MNPADPDIHAARELFPRGLSQPEHGFRFGVDALLLAAFAREHAAAPAIDLGCGCGAAGLALLLEREETRLHVTAVDVDPAMCACAGANAEALGLAEQVRVARADLSETAALRDAGLEPESFRTALCNPPYFDPGRGREPDAAKATARHGDAASLEAFLSAAAWLLAPKGRLALVFGAARLVELLDRLAAVRLEPKRLRLVHGSLSAPARLALVEARKLGRPELTVEPPLILYDGDGALTPEAQGFCRFLACNPRRGAGSCAE